MVTYDDMTADVWYIAVNLPEMSREPNDNSNLCVIVVWLLHECLPSFSPAGIINVALDMPFAHTLFISDFRLPFYRHLTCLACTSS